MCELNLTFPVISCTLSFLPLTCSSLFHPVLFSWPLIVFTSCYISFLQSLCSFLIIATFLHLGTLQWVDPFSRLQKTMTIPWEVGGRFGLASINLCALPCGRWCLTLMVRTKFHLAFILLQLYLRAIWPHIYNNVNAVFIANTVRTLADTAVHISKYSNTKIWSFF